MNLKNLSVLGCVLGFLANAAWAFAYPPAAPFVLLAAVATVVLIAADVYAPAGWMGLTARNRWCMKRAVLIPSAAITAFAFSVTAHNLIVPHGFLSSMLIAILPAYAPVFAYMAFAYAIWGRPPGSEQEPRR